MPHPFAPPTIEILNDAAIAAGNDGRDRGINDWDTRKRFLDAASEAFDRFADPTGEFAPAREDAQP